MSIQSVRACPWMTYPNSSSAFTGGGYPGWHPGQNPLNNKSYAHTFTNKITLDGVDWWGGASPTRLDKPENFFRTDKSFQSSIQNNSRQNVLILVGSSVDLTSFTNPSFTYSDTAAGSRARNIIGFGCQNSCGGSYSDKGGNSQAYLEKVGFFYADPVTYRRSNYVASVKVSGNHNINQLYPDQSYYYYSYRLSDSDIAKVKDQKLLCMGMALQYVHDARTSTHTSACLIKNMRWIAGDGSGLVQPSQINRIMILAAATTTLKDSDIAVTYG